MIPDMKPKVDFLSCSGIGKRYSFEWVFKDFDYNQKKEDVYPKNNSLENYENL